MGKYDIASQHLDTAMKKANYMLIYLIMMRLKVMLQEYDKVIYWLKRMDSEALSDPCWKCANCSKKLEHGIISVQAVMVLIVCVIIKRANSKTLLYQCN
ncbi:hypothetical protein [Wolbachia endosymbiont of Atemnus politus]|uniref:hypothetical protein n=1 Tax=Wolbachia endosymbiont of Atemnus politus TaxID=2682840 RepID=UPI001FEA7B2E|nr:hypothetical protein [Wolbachia endosymbiont of Atemnus politus]